MFIDRCPSGTDGKQCETAPERCIGNPCMHHGRCQDFGSGLNCTCPEDYTGIGCQYEYDACQAGACKNGATCIDEGSGFTCICPPGYTGNSQYTNNCLFNRIKIMKQKIINCFNFLCSRSNLRRRYNRLQGKFLPAIGSLHRSYRQILLPVSVQFNW